MPDDTFTLAPSRPPHTRALLVAGVYLAVSAAWIVVTDVLVSRMVTDPEGNWQTWKGLAFVVASSALIYALVRREVLRAREGAERFSALVEQSLAGIYLIRGERFLYLNPALAGIFGYTPGEMARGIEVSQIASDDERERVQESLRASESGGLQQLQFRFTGRRKGGEAVRVEVHGRRVMWEGEPAILGVALEVGERERLERQVQEAQRLKALGELTGQIAHDFNNFLTGIIGPLDLCLMDLPDDGAARADVEQARATALRAASLSRKLLSFSRKRPALARPVDLNDVLEEMESLLDRLVGASIRLSLDLDPGSCTVMIDPTDAEQVVMNLVLNAAEAIDGTGTVTVRTRRDRPAAVAPAGEEAGQGKGVVRLEVEDDGAGIPDGVLEWIFDPFFTTKEDGTGLGLSTVFGIASQIGGSIDVRTDRNAGTRFVVTLPAAASAVPAHAEDGPCVGEGSGSERVLLVDDEDVVRDVTRRALERYGYEVISAADGASAVKLARDDGRFDLLLTDVQLPDMVGPDVAEQVTAHDPSVRVLFMSGFSNQEVIARLSATPSARLVQKPFRIEELVRNLRAVLDGPRPPEAGAGS